MTLKKICTTREWAIDSSVEESRPTVLAENEFEHGKIITNRNFRHISSVNFWIQGPTRLKKIPITFYE